MTFVHDDGTLILAEWGHRHVHDGEHLTVDPHRRGAPMFGTTATGDPLVSNGFLGVDAIRVPAGAGFAPHTHPGDHLLIVVHGEGTITYDGRIYPTRAGQVYMVEGAVPHAVGAITDHVILAVGAPHRPVDAADRMELTAYAAVATSFGKLACLQCERDGTPDELRAGGCVHVPPQPSDARPLVVGLAPATARHEASPPFVDTRSGARLAALFDVDPVQLLVVADTVNLSPTWIPRWETVRPTEWRDLAAERVLPHAGGRVLVACGRTVARALGARAGESHGLWVTVDVVDWDVEHGPALVVTIPHPSGLSRAWNDDTVGRRAAAALRLASTLARTGPPSGTWTEGDAYRVADAVERAASQHR